MKQKTEVSSYALVGHYMLMLECTCLIHVSPDNFITESSKYS